MTNDAVTQAKLTVAIIVTIGFVGCIFVLMFAKVDLTSGAEKALLILVGALAMQFGQIVNYYFGSSAGSAAKTEMLASIANGAPK